MHNERQYEIKQKAMPKTTDSTTSLILSNRILFFLVCIYFPMIGFAQCDRRIQPRFFPSKMIEWNLEISKSKDNFLQYKLKIGLELVKAYKHSANIEDVLIIEIEGYTLDGVGIEKLDENFYAVQVDLDYHNNNGTKYHYTSMTYSSNMSKTVNLTLDPNASTYKFEALGVTRLLPSKYNTEKCICEVNYIDSFSIERIADLAPSISTLVENYKEENEFKIHQFTYPKAKIKCTRREED